MRANSWKFKSVKLKIQIRCSFLPPSLINSVISPFPSLTANYLWLGHLKSSTNWRAGRAWEAASLLKDTCLILYYWGRNRKHCWVSRQCYTGRVFDWIITAAIFLRIRKARMIFRKTLAKKGTRNCYILISSLNTLLQTQNTGFES